MKTRSLKFRILVFSTTMVIVVLSSLSSILLYYHSKYVWEEFDLRVSSMATALSHDLKLHVMLENKREIERMLKGRLEIPDVVFIKVLNNSQEILAHSKNKSPTSSEYYRTIHSDIEVESDIIMEELLEPTKRAGLEKIGSVAITFSTFRLENDLKGMIFLAVSFTILIILIRIFFDYLFITKVTKPIEKLVRMTQAVAQGDLTQSVDIVQHDEVGILSSSFNSMVKFLKERDDKLSASLKEKELLLKEIHHRVKNNMQLISSMIKLQAKYVTNKKDREMFLDCQSRVKTMALIHEKLYKSTDMAHINFQLYIKDLARELFRFYTGGVNTVQLNVDVENVSIGIDTAIPCGLIINELVSNTLKYAFLDGEKGKIDILLRILDQGALELTVRDNGIGLPKNLIIEKTESLGLKMVSTLAAQLRGEMEINREKGTEFKIVFKEPIYMKRI